MVDWHFVALPIVQIRGAKNPIEEFKDWVSRMVVISPIPVMFSSESSEETLYPDEHVSNFADWFNGVLSAYPASYSVIEKFLRQTMPDFQDFQNKSVGENTKRVVVRFGGDDFSLPLDFSRLSSGEKMFFVCALLLGANKYYGPTFCYWDEPDNYVSMAEVGHMMQTLRKSFKASGQLFVTSHNAETVRKFSDDTTLCLSRKSHMEPTMTQWLSQLHYDGDLINALIRGDIANGE